MKSPLAWLALGVFVGVWSWLMWPASPWLLGSAATLLLLSKIKVRASLFGLGLCLGQALVWTQPEPGELRKWTSGEVRSVTGQSALILTPEGHLSTRLWPAPPPVGTRLAGHLVPTAQRQELPGEWPHQAQSRLARAQQVRMKIWTSLEVESEPPDLLDELEHPGLIRALGTGDRSDVPQHITDLLRRTGTIHLLAISGLHVGMISMMAGLMVWMLTRGLTRGRWPPIARTLPVVSSAAMAVAYGALVQWPISTQRAAVMVVGASIISLSGRRPSPWQMLGLAALVVLCIQPSQAASLGFLMSFGAVTAILLGMPVWTQLTGATTPWLIRALSNSIGASVFATLGTLPITAWVFQSVPLGGPLANLLAVPLFAGLGVPCAIVGTLGPTWLHTPALWVADQALSLALLWIGACDLGLMTPALWPVAAVTLVGAIATISRPRWAFIMLICALIPWRTTPAGFTVTFPAVGQGSTALITWPDGRYWLIDGGPPGKRLLHWLRREGISRLDRVILSHPDHDHFGGLIPVVESLKVDEFWTSRRPIAGEQEYLKLWRSVHAHSVDVRTPDVPAHGTDEDNDTGLILTLRHGAHRFLLLGDVSENIEERLAESMPSMTVVQVSHHGSKTSSSPALITAAAPRAAVIQSGVSNRYGHPHAQTLSRWNSTKVLRTDTLGSLRFRSDGESMVIQFWKDLSGWRSLPDRRPEFH